MLDYKFSHIQRRESLVPTEVSTSSIWMNFTVTCQDERFRPWSCYQIDLCGILMKYCPLKRVDWILEKMYLQLEGVLETLLLIMCHYIKKWNIAPEVGRVNQDQPQNPQNQTLRIQGKPLPFQTAVNSDSKTSSYCINMLHNSYTVSKIHKHMLTIFLRADHTTGAADIFLGTWWALPAHPFTALKEGERWGAGKPPVYVGGMCPGFLDRQSSQGCRFPFPASRWWSWLFFLHLLQLCPCPAHLTHSYLATWSLLPFCAVFSSTHPDFLIIKL